MRQYKTNISPETGESLPIEGLLFELSARFINLPSEKVDSEIDEALRSICECLSLDRSTIWLLPQEEPDTIVLTHIHQRPDAPPAPGRAEAARLFPWALEQLKRGELVIVSALDDLPPEAARDAESWRLYGTKSSLVIPLCIGGVVFGALSFASLREQRDWPEGLIKRLELFAQVLANATARARSDRTLRENAERLRLVTDTAGVGLWVLAINTNQVWATARTRELFNFGPDEEVDMEAIFSRVHPEDVEMVRGAVARASEVGTEFWLEYRALRPGGDVRWISSRGSAEGDSSGKPVRVMGVSVDVTERRRAEAALAEFRAQIVAVFESTNDLIWSVDPKNFGILTFNTALAGYFLDRGIQMQKGMTPEDLLPPDYAERWVEFYRRALKQGSFVTEYSTVSRTRVLLLSLNTLERGGEVFGIAVFGKDITDRKRVEEELRRSEERFRQVAENVGDFIWEVDASGLYTYTSASVGRILGYNPDELVGKRYYYDLFAPDSREELKLAGARVFAAKESFRAFPNANVARDGSTVYLETSGSPILDKDGNLLGYRGADTDVTPRRKAEEQLHRSLEEVKRLRDQLQQENVYLREEMDGLYRQGRLVGQSRALKHVLAQAAQVASTDSTVLLLGETGTGKELIASAIHESSPRRDRTMVRVNCAAIPASLLESELFGREKGAYTGALSKQVGRFEMADQSTLFLDEIGEIPPEVQAKLLRVLQDKKIERLGGTKTFHVDVRIITATNRDLAKSVREGRFREDLYYRLNVFPITLPPLRDRREDIPVLVSSFVEEFSGRFGRNIESIARESMAALQRYHWPGNVRELRNVIERAMIVSTGPKLFIESPDGAGPASSTPLLAMRDAESQHIRQILEMTNWRIRGKNGAAEILGLKPTTLESRMIKLGIRRPDKGPTK